MIQGEPNGAIQQAVASIREFHMATGVAAAIGLLVVIAITLSTIANRLDRLERTLAVTEEDG